MAILGAATVPSTFTEIIGTVTATGSTTRLYGTASARLDFFQPSSTVWARFSRRLYVATAIEGAPHLELLSGGDVIFRLVVEGRDFCAAEMWDGSSWVVLGVSSTSFGTNATVNVVMEYVASDTAGKIRVQMDGNTVLDFEGQTARAGFTSVDTVVFRSAGPTTETYYTQYENVLLTDEDLTYFVLVDSGVTGNGDLQQWTGNESAIDDDFDDTDFIAGQEPGLESTFTYGDLNSVYETGYEVAGVIDVARARRAEAGPDLQLIDRQGGVNYDGPVPTMGTSFEGHRHFWTLNPATGLPWTVAEVNARQSGYRTILP